MDNRLPWFVWAPIGMTALILLILCCAIKSACKSNKKQGNRANMKPRGGIENGRMKFGRHNYGNWPPAYVYQENTGDSGGAHHSGGCDDGRDIGGHHGSHHSSGAYHGGGGHHSAGDHSGGHHHSGTHDSCDTGGWDSGGGGDSGGGCDSGGGDSGGGGVD